MPMHLRRIIRDESEKAFIVRVLPSDCDAAGGCRLQDSNGRNEYRTAVKHRSRYCDILQKLRVTSGRRIPHIVW